MVKKCIIIIFLGLALTACSSPKVKLKTEPANKSKANSQTTNSKIPSGTIVAASETGPKTIIYDNFSKRKSEWQQIRGNWHVNNSGHFIQGSSNPRHINSIVYIDHPQAADATIETYVRVTPDIPGTLTDSRADKELRYSIRYTIGAGIVFRMKDQENFYMFRLAGEEGAVLGKMVKNQWIDLANPRVADYLPQRILFSGNYWYRLKVEIYGDRIKCYINDSVVANVADTTYNLGKFGLCTFKTGAAFDYFKVTDKTEREVR